MADATALRHPDAARVHGVLGRYREGVLAAMRSALDGPGIEHARLMRYHLGWTTIDGDPEPAAGGGKMLRPALCLLCCEAVGGDARVAMPAAAALELVHNFTLIHDDIEDSSDTRHGRDTLWRRAGVAQAINAGDGMFVLAQRTLLRLANTGVPARRVLKASEVLNDACTALCEGQYADIGFEARAQVSLAEYQAMVAGKTAALLSASMAVGAVAGGASSPTVAAIAECGRLLGLAFQIQDDVLGIWGVAGVTGKPVADDIRSRKKSFPVVYAFEHLDAAAAERLRRIYSSPDLGDADVEDVLSLLESVDARGVATTEAARWAAAATQALAPLGLDPERRRDIEALASFFVYRAA